MPVTTISRSVVIVLLALCVVACNQSSSGPVDLIVHNADIWTMNQAQPRASAMAIADGKVRVLGSAEQVLSLAAPSTKVIDLAGRTLVPGFNDAHMHPMMVDPGSVDLGYERIADISGLVERLRERASKVPPGEWILGWNYDDKLLGAHPDRTVLDSVSTRHPILLTHTSGHVATANSLAYEAAGVDRSTQNPTGGSFDRGVDGEPSGVCREPPACDLLYSERFPRPARTLTGSMAQLREAIGTFHGYGITSLGDAYVTPELFAVYMLSVNDEHPVRANLMFIEHDLAFAKWAKRFQGLIDWISGERIRVQSIKLFHGNSLSGQTCWLYEPYADRPDYYGVPPARSQEELNARVKEIHDAGFQLAIHANGDREIDMVLDAIELALKDNPRPDHRHRIEHASIMNAEILARVKELGVVLALHSYVYEHGEKMAAYGEHRYPWMHANRAALEAGIPLAGNSDYPVSGAEVTTRLRSLMTRTSRQGMVYGAQQRLSAEQAIATYTHGSAYATYEDAVKGRLAPGSYADFVVLSDSPGEVAPEAVSDIEVLMTVLEGELVFLRPGYFRR